MALIWEVKTLADLDPAIAALYAAQPNGTYRLDVVAPEQVTKAIDAERRVRKQVEHAARQAIDQSTEELDATKAERDAALARATAFERPLFEAAVRRAAEEAGTHAVAFADVLRAARERFDVTPEGTLAPKDAGGLDLAAWLAAARDESPHWFPATGSGSGAQQNMGTGDVRAR